MRCLEVPNDPTPFISDPWQMRVTPELRPCWHRARRARDAEESQLRLLQRSGDEDGSLMFFFF